MAIDIIARGMIEEFNSDISQLSEKVSNHTDNSDIHVTVSDKENWNSHPNDVTATGNPVIMDGLQGGVPFSEIAVSGENIIGQDLTVNVSGKNLLKYPYQNTNTTHNGVTFTVNNDGSIIANGTAKKNATFTLWDSNHKFAINSNETYTLSGCPLGGSNTTFALYNIGTEDIDYGDGKTFTEKSDFAPKIAIYKGYTANNLVFRPQLELGDTATEYEPYHGSITTITPDSNPYVIPNDIRQQDGLNNISVSEGEISVTGVRKNAAIKRIWDEIDEIKTAIIVSNGESE